MASGLHRGWLLNREYGILAGVYNGTLSGNALFPANTALNAIFVGTPVTPALALDSFVLSNTIASGDILLAANNGGNSQAWLWIDSSAGNMTLYGAGTAAAIISATAAEVQDNILLALGNDQDNVLLNRADTLAATTVLTGVLVGTPITAATPANSLLLSNITASGDIAFFVNTAASSVEHLRLDASAGLVVFNEASGNVDFRVETTDLAFAICADGAKNAICLAANTDITNADIKVYVGRPATTVSPNTSFVDFLVAPAGAATVQNGTTSAYVASAEFREPNITATGTVTNAVTVYILDAPDEGGTGNYALWVDAGVTRLDGNLNMAAAANDLVIIAATAAALEISDGTTKFYAFDTRVTTAGVTTHALDVGDYTIASGATNVVTSFNLAAHTLNYTSNIQVTTQVNTFSLGARTIVSDTATLTVDAATTLRATAPVEGTNVLITAASAIRIGDAGGTPANQYGIFIETLTAGATADYAIWVAGANAVHLGTAGTATGLLEIDGATSGTMTLTAAAATTSYTLTLPAAANANAGYQLTCAGADTITSWGAAGSLRALKEIHGEHDAQDALDKLLGTRVYDFHYKLGKGTQDHETAYVGVLADEAPWAMHYAGGVVNPVNTLGYTILGFQAMAAKVAALEARLAALAA